MKKVWIEELEILEDYKKKCSGIDYQWLESRLHGKYEIAYQSAVVHSRGKVKSRGGILHEDWQDNEVLRSNRVSPTCNFKTKGSSSNKNGLTTWAWWEDNQNTNFNSEKFKVNQPKPFISENYKPWRDTIYLIIYEYDKPQAGRVHSIDVNYWVGKKYKIEYSTRKNEGPFGDKKNSNSVVGFNSITPAPASPSIISKGGQVIMITPNSWPNKGLNSILFDELVIEGKGSSTGNDADTWSLKIKLKYGPF